MGMRKIRKAPARLTNGYNERFLARYAVSSERRMVSFRPSSAGRDQCLNTTTSDHSALGIRPPCETLLEIAISGTK